jgi:hypothetical protein
LTIFGGLLQDGDIVAPLQETKVGQTGKLMLEKHFLPHETERK